MMVRGLDTVNTIPVKKKLLPNKLLKAEMLLRKEISKTLNMELIPKIISIIPLNILKKNITFLLSNIKEIPNKDSAINDASINVTANTTCMALKKPSVVDV